MAKGGGAGAKQTKHKSKASNQTHGVDTASTSGN